MQRLDEEAVGAHLVQSGLAHPRHRPHRYDDVFGVGELDTELGVLGAQRAHTEGHHIHGASAHAAAVQVGHDAAHLGRFHPVVGGAGVDLTLGTDEGARFHARHVGGVRQRQVGVRLLLVVEAFEGARRPPVGLAQPRVLLLGAVGEHNPVGLCQFGDLLDPCEQPLVLSRCGVQTWNGRCGHRSLLCMFLPAERLSSASPSSPLEVNLGDIPAVKSRSMSDHSQERFRMAILAVYRFSNSEFRNGQFADSVLSAANAPADPFAGSASVEP